MFHPYIIFFAIFLNLVGDFFYIKSIMRGHAKPNLVSWVMWMLAPFFGFFFLVKAGATFSALPVFMAGFGPFLIILFSIFVKNGYWKINAFDIYCGILSLIALIFYIFTHNLSIAILFAILSDALAGVPTIIKSWKFPETENSLIYLFAMVSNIIGLSIIKIWSFQIASFSVHIILQCIIILFCLYRKKIFTF